MRILLVWLLVLLSAIGTVSNAQETARSLDFYLTFVPNIQFAPLYVAKAAGYFREAGIQLEKFIHQDEPLLVERLAINDISFAVISGEQVITARAQGRLLVYVFEWFQKYPVGIVVGQDSNIHTVTDLTGRPVGIPGRFGASYSGLLALLGANNLSEEAIRLDAIGYNAPDVFCAGIVDAAVVYLNNEPLQIQQRVAQGDCGEVSAIQLFPVSDAVDLVSNGIVTNEQTLNTDPELIAAVNRAFHLGLRDTIENPAAAYLHSAQFVESLPLSPTLAEKLQQLADEQAAFLSTAPSREALAQSRDNQLATLAELPEIAAELTQFRVLLASISLWEAEQLGFSDLGSWQATAETLRAMGFLSGEIDLSSAYTNQYLDIPGE